MITYKLVAYSKFIHLSVTRCWFC